VMKKAGIIPGIKVDKGPQPLAGFPGDVVTEGLDGLRERLQEYARLGAKFAKWRAVINIREDNPSSTAIAAKSSTTSTGGARQPSACSSPPCRHRCRASCSCQAGKPMSSPRPI
jgi:fructose-bisphosphate aldolase class 1